MNGTLALLLAPLAAGLAVSVVSLWRDEEPRMAVVVPLFPLLALRHFLLAPALAESVSQLIATPYGSGLAIELGINCAAALTAVTLARSLRERNRAERVQWESMEAVRALSEVLAERRGALDEALPELLGLGCRQLGLELGVHTRIFDGQSSVVCVHGPPGGPIKQGDAFPLCDTLCDGAVETDAPLAIEQVSGSHWAARAAHARLGIESYLGAPIGASGQVVGTLYFASREPRALRFSGVDKQLLVLMSEWLGSEIEREQLASIAAQSEQPAAAANRTRLIPRRGDHPDRRRLDVNGALLQLQDEMSSACGNREGLTLSLAPQDPIVKLRRNDFDRVLWSLLWSARDAMPSDAALRISTESAPTPPGAATLTPFVTLTIAADGPGLDSNGMARLFADFRSTAPIASREGRLSLPRAQRLLQASDGDLSVHSDPEGGTTLTAYLPGLPETEADTGAAAQ